jgi:hypothetical protein
MSGFPTPRLGRAVRLFTPVVLAGALAVPMLSPAKEHGDKAHNKGNVPAAQAPDPNVIVTPASPADDNPAAGADNSANQSQAPADVPADNSASDNAADDSPSSNDAAADSSSNSAADDSSNASQKFEDAPGFTAASENRDEHADDHGDDRGDDNGDDQGHDNGDDHGRDNDHGRGDDNGRGNGKGKNKSNKGNAKGKGHGKDDNPGRGHDKDNPGKGHDKDNPGKGHDKDNPGKGHDKDNPGKGHDKGHGKGHDKDKGKDHDNGKGNDRDSDNSAPQSVPAPSAALGSSLTNAVTQVTSSRVCTSRRAVTIRLDRGYRVRTARVLLNGRLVRVVRHNKRVTASINLRGRAKGTYTVRTVVVTKGNKIRIGSRKYMTCSPKRLSSRPRY